MRPGRRHLLPLAHQTSNEIEVAVAADGGIDEVGERPATDVRLVVGVRGIVDADEIVVRLSRAIGGERGPAAGERDQRELRVGAHRYERRLGVGDQAIGRFLFAKLGRGDGVGQARGAPETDLARFLGQTCRLGRTGDRIANRAAVDLGP